MLQQMDCLRSKKRTTMPTQRRAHGHLTPKLAIQLAAPHTWPASLFPVLIGSAVAQLQLNQQGSSASPVMVCVLLAISVLMQSAVNTINDYFDYVKGTDTRENQADPSDAVLVYNDIEPAEARNLAIGFVLAAFLLGIYCIVKAGFAPLVIALVGVAVIYLYSGGKTPISYLPIGEIVSGGVMGGMIALASHCCCTGRIDWMMLVYALPLVLGIALFMMTNNTCDIEKDKKARRKTLPVLLGRQGAARLYHAIVYAWTGLICLIVLVWFTNGWVVLPFMLLAVHPLARALLANPLTAASRASAFAQCMSLNIALGAFYAASIFASGYGLA